MWIGVVYTCFYKLKKDESTYSQGSLFSKWKEVIILLWINMQEKYFETWKGLGSVF